MKSWNAKKGMLWEEIGNLPFGHLPRKRSHISKLTILPTLSRPPEEGDYLDLSHATARRAWRAWQEVQWCQLFYLGHARKKLKFRLERWSGRHEAVSNQRNLPNSSRHRRKVERATRGGARILQKPNGERARESDSFRRVVFKRNSNHLSSTVFHLCLRVIFV